MGADTFKSVTVRPWLYSAVVQFHTRFWCPVVLGAYYSAFLFANLATEKLLSKELNRVVSQRGWKLDPLTLG